jgi:hypothetical protein
MDAFPPPVAPPQRPWLAWSEAVFATHTHLLCRLPAGLATHHIEFFNVLDWHVDEALAGARAERIENLAAVFVSNTAYQGMGHVNALLDLYRALKLHSLTLADDREHARVQRALFRELWHLMRRRIQALMGREVTPITRVLYRAGSLTGPLFSAWCDGSFRQGRGYAGFVLHDPSGATVVEASVRVAARASHDTEVESFRLMLSSALAIGVNHLRVHVDAAGLANYTNGTAALKDCVQESAIEQLLRRFDFFELVKVPRLYNSHADELARRLKG